jgi:hypothetical protein
MKFLLYLFFLVFFTSWHAPLSAATQKEQLFDSFCQAVLRNDISKIQEIICHHKSEVERFINEPHTSSCIQSRALHYAAFAGNKRIIKLLLLHGADPLLQNGVHFNAFNYARQNKHSNLLIDAIQEVEALKNERHHEQKAAYPITINNVCSSFLQPQLLSLILLFAFFLFCIAQETDQIYF